MKSPASKVHSVSRRKKPLQVILKGGEPSAVILDIVDYRKLLERAEDADDLRVLDRMRKRPVKFRKLDEYLSERRAGV